MGYFGIMLRFLCAMSMIWVASGATRWNINMSLSQYARFISQGSNAGYFPARTCGYNVNGKVYYAAVMKKRNGEGWTIRYNVNTVGLARAYKFLVDNGNGNYRIASLSGYEWNGQHRFTAIFHRTTNKVPIQARWRQTAAQFWENLGPLLKLGYTPVYQSGYTVNGVSYFNTVYEKKNAIYAAWRINMAEGEYNEVNRELQPRGVRLLSVNGYGNARITAAWEQTNGPAQIPYVGVKTPRDKPGYMITHVCGYFNSAGLRYTVVWTKETN